MSLSHRISLRGPWEYEMVASGPGFGDLSAGGPNRPLPRPARAHFPAGWDELFGTFSGRARFRRRFHRPTNLDSDERVFVELEAVGGAGRLFVNGVDLGVVSHSADPQRFDVTDHLTGNDELVIELNWNGEICQPERGGLYGPVVLEIIRLAH